MAISQWTKRLLMGLGMGPTNNSQGRRKNGYIYIYTYIYTYIDPMSDELVDEPMQKTNGTVRCC